VAETGWTTSELAEQILHTQLNEVYDFVTLLIGVNNQFRGLSLKDYTDDFEFLLRKAVHLANDNPDRVIILSLPDWGRTPFAKNKDSQKISEEIDAFNVINKAIASNYKVHYIDITEGTRIAAEDASFIASDGLHPSAKEYEKWAEEVSEVIIASIKQ
jgi:lysophospholipase L1-like esterase